MQCPKCGQEIEEGHLLCEKCGYEIQVVPDFEAEVDRSISETMTGIIEGLPEEFLIHPDEELFEEKRHFPWFAVSSISILLILIAIVGGMFYHYYKSPDYQMKQATKYVENNDYDHAAEAIKRAEELGSDYATVHLALADVYLNKGDIESFRNTIFSIINHQGLSDQDIIFAYDRLVGYYVSTKQYDAINNILVTAALDEVKVKYNEYMAKVPEFNYTEGSYDEVIPLKITANTEGTIYYTLDGSEPDKHSSVYDSPIFLDTGDYVLTAVFYNSYGVKSPMAQSSYHVEVIPPDMPEVESYSGEYFSPQLIQVEAEEGCEIYYTLDGSIPTEESTKYNGFLPMPMGDSEIKFVAIDENHTASEVITRNYSLNLLTDYSRQDAMTVILDYLVQSGLIVDRTGAMVSDPLQRYYYNFACTVPIGDDGDFYIFSEYIIHADGSKEKTQRYFAVGVYNLPLYLTNYDATTVNFALTSGQLNETPQN